jgi:hypothetical protein
MNKLPFQQALERIRAEYQEMPGMKLTLEQVERLSGVDRSVCQQVLDALVNAKFLSLRNDGSYTRAQDGSPYASARREGGLAYSGLENPLVPGRRLQAHGPAGPAGRLSVTMRPAHAGIEANRSAACGMPIHRRGRMTTDRRTFLAARKEAHCVE